MSALTAQALQVSLNGRVILNDITLSCESGFVHGLIGPNGAGKSTLLKCLAGLIAVDAGSIELAGTPLSTLTLADRAKRIAYLPQSGEVAWPITVERLVALGRMPHRDMLDRDGKADEAMVARTLRRMDAVALGPMNADRLSAGERARALLARALAVQAPILLADEPVAALDPLHQLTVMETLRDEAKSGAAVIVVLHDLTLAARFCDRLFLLHQGKLIADGAPGSVLTADRLGSAFGITAFAGQHEEEAFVIPWRPR